MYVRWLKYELVLQPAHLLNAAKTPSYIAVKVFGAGKLKKHVRLRTVYTLYALRGVCSLAVFVEKP